MISYRPDIDGLRALSVVAVILFHAGVPGFEGGFIGVDVFFVISGYLITRLLLDSEGASIGTRLRDFYARRARRILPALLVAMFAILIAGMLIVLPRELRSMGKTLGLAALLQANVAAWLNVGYFTAKGVNAAALHLWSIAVEEQFYLLYPLALLLLGRFAPRYLRAAVALGVLISFGSCVYYSYWSPAANFYLMPSRAWELGLGALLALGVVPAFVHRHAQVLAGLSLLTVIAAVFVYSPALRWPGVFTLPVALAAALLIATAQTVPTLAGRWLAVRPLVFTGLISYSLYLWHAPVLTLFGYYHIRPLDPLTLAALLAFIYLLSVASWRWIEKPVRARRVLRSQSVFAVAALVASLGLSAAAWALWRSDGLPQRFSQRIQRIVDPANSYRASDEDCVSLSLERVARGELCRYGSAKADAPRMVLWGDSHALSLLPAYEAQAHEQGFALYFGGKSSCQPVINATPAPAFDVARVHCERFNAAMLHAIERLQPRAVTLAGFWRSWNSRNVRADDTIPPERAREFARSLELTARLVSAGSRRVCAVTDVPQLRYDALLALGMAEMRGIDAGFIRLTAREAARQQEPINGPMARLAREGKLVMADPAQWLCTGAACVVERDGVPLYRDSSHLTVAGAAFVAPGLRPCWSDPAP